MPTPFVFPEVKKGPFAHGADSNKQEGVPEGTISAEVFKSEIFPGTYRDMFTYVPAQYTADKPAAVMVFQDGHWYQDRGSVFRATTVMDNLIHQGKMPVTIGIFLNPGLFPATGPEKKPVSNRSFEYDSLTNQYVRFLVEEIFPLVGSRYKLTDDPEMRAICGASSGGICSFTAAWERPDVFRKVLSHVGSFQNIRGGHVYPALVRANAKKPIRVFLQAGMNDIDNAWGNWAIGNLGLAASLNFMEYDYKLEMGDGAHNGDHGGAILAESMEWLWRK
jgi:enterochelin esterase-like enzyme